MGADPTRNIKKELILHGQNGDNVNRRIKHERKKLKNETRERNLRS